MRKLLLTLAMVGVLAGLADAQNLPPKNNLVYGGLQYTTKVGIGEKALVLGGGYGWRVTGNLWQFTTGQIGTTGYVAAEPVLAWVFPLSGKEGGTKLRGALIGGVSGDWLQFTESTVWTAYVPGTVGLSLFLEFSNGAGFVLSGREKFSLAEGTAYHDGLLFNLNVMKRF